MYYLPTSYWSNERVCTQIAHSYRKQTDTPNIDSCRGQSWLMQASVRTVGQASYLQTTYQFDVRRHWDAVSTQTPCHIHIVSAR